MKGFRIKISFGIVKMFCGFISFVGTEFLAYF